MKGANLKPNLDIELQILSQNNDNSDFLICGLDEVGRGALAGPVLSAVVAFPNNVINQYADNSISAEWQWLYEINDSKKLSLKKRENLSNKIKEYCFWGVGLACVEEIDKINILQASLLSMQRAYVEISKKTTINYALVDGTHKPILYNLQQNYIQSVVKGDSKSLSIAAASIIAKVERDNLMKDLSKTNPEYNWDSNVGYGTKKHIDAMISQGLTNHHRKSFTPVKLKNNH